MTPENAIWLLGISVVPAFGWMIWVSWNLKMSLRYLNRMDSTTNTMKQVIDRNTQAIKALANLIEWLGEKQEYGKPPPHVDI